MCDRGSSIDFIQSDLIPEMVQDRCFCEANSREFVEFESASVELANSPNEFSSFCEIYRAKAVVRFSGEPCRFSLLVKLLPNTDGDDSGTGFEAFQNEEMFYTKMTLKYGRNYAPKCYLSDLGRYGRPVIVLEDLEAQGYTRPNNKLDEDHLKLCVKLLGSFHGRGLKLKAEKFNDFREFYAKLSEISFSPESLKYYQHRLSRIASMSKQISDRKLAEKVRRKLGENPLETAKYLASEINDVSTICQGHFSRDNLLFKYQNEKPVDAKLINWQTMRYCSAGIDLGLLLFGNLPWENRLSKVQEILAVYVDAVKREYPEISGERFMEDAVSKFLFAGVILSFQENITMQELFRIFLDLDHLRVFE